MKFKNISGQNLNVIGVGLVEKGQEVEMPDGFNNANFEPIKKTKKVKDEEVDVDDELETKN